MAGNLNSDSVIWVAGDTTGKNAAGASTAIPGDLLATVSGTVGLATEAYVNARSAETRSYSDNVTLSGVGTAGTYADAAVGILHARLVASGILES